MFRLQLWVIKQLNALVKIFYPPKCILCRKLLDDMDSDFICRLCLNHYHQERPNILQDETRLQEVKTKELFINRETGEVIEWQLESDQPVQIITLFPYAGNYREAILRWKYQGIRRYAAGFAWLLLEEQHIFKDFKADLVVPVPLAPARMRERGFNQALDLARQIGSRAQVPVWNCLKRNKNTKPQAECSREERYKNIKGSISFNKEAIVEKDTQNSCNDDYEKLSATVNYVALVDDIYTTGSTVKECIKVLKEQEIFRNAVMVVIAAGKGDF